MRATSYLPWFMASMARSKSTLSGCFELTLAMGLATLLWWQPTANAISEARITRAGRRRNIKTSIKVQFAMCNLQNEQKRLGGKRHAHPLEGPPHFLHSTLPITNS